MVKGSDSSFSRQAEKWSPEFPLGLMSAPSGAQTHPSGHRGAVLQMHAWLKGAFAGLQSKRGLLLSNLLPVITSTGLAKCWESF